MPKVCAQFMKVGIKNFAICYEATARDMHKRRNMVHSWPGCDAHSPDILMNGVSWKVLIKMVFAGRLRKS